MAHSLAQRYGSRARMFGRAHVSKLKAPIFVSSCVISLFWRSSMILKTMMATIGANPL